MAGNKGVQRISDNLSESAEFKNYLDVTKQFFNLIKEIDGIPEVVRRPQHESRSLYIASSRSSLDPKISGILNKFFGKASKPAGKAVPMSLKFNSSIKSMGGVKKSQTLYTKKVKSGLYYAAIWPWSKDPSNMTINMGYSSHSMSDKDYNKLEKIVSNKILDQAEDSKSVGKMGGQIHGINLSAFLQMSAMEKSTCTLKVLSGKEIGYVYLKDGDLINALYGKYKGLEAIYRIVIWEDTVIEIEKPVKGILAEINMPLMHILMEGLKKKDEYEQRHEQETVQEDATDGFGFITPDTPDLITPDSDEDDEDKIDEEEEAEIAKQSEEDINEAIEKISKKVEKKKKRSKYLYIAITGAVIVLAVTAYFTHTQVEKSRITSELAQINANSQDPVSQLQQFKRFSVKYKNKDEFYKEANAKIAIITRRIADNNYQELLKKIDEGDFQSDIPEMMKIYQEFLKNNPGGAHNQKVVAEIRALEKKLERKDYDEVLKYAKGNDPERVLIFHETLKKHPNKEFSEDIKKLISDTKEEFYTYLEKEISRLEKREEWSKILEKIARFSEIYGSEDKDTLALLSKKGYYENQAKYKNIFDILKHNASIHESDYPSAIEVYESYLKKYPETLNTEKISKELVILYRLKKAGERDLELEEVRKRFSQLKKRFTLLNDGLVVKDKKSGLMWCTIDSETDLNECTDYETAGKYVSELDTGGYTDWRVPTAKELQKLYKTKPFFPSDTETWYWSSTHYKKFLKELLKIVDVVDTENTTTIKKIQKDSRECGSIRAVRGK